MDVVDAAAGGSASIGGINLKGAVEWDRPRNCSF
jgi:hypothetical protein